jgi:hypothetical protein
MPIGELTEFEPDHFKKVYEHIFKPAIEAAGFIPHRSDDDKSSHYIHASMIKDLIEAPMALCDLSTRNPNVLYELGIRHAFNKPVVLIQQKGTEKIFDINGINTTDYRQTRIYDEVLEDQKKIQIALEETASAKKHYSLTQLINIEPAMVSKDALTPSDTTTIMLSNILTELRDLKSEKSMTIYYDNFAYDSQDRKEVSRRAQLVFYYNKFIEDVLQLEKLDEDHLNDALLQIERRIKTIEGSTRYLNTEEKKNFVKYRDIYLQWLCNKQQSKICNIADD